MDINRRKQSEERSKGLSVFSASVGMEKWIFPSSHTEGTITLCFLKGTCPRKLAYGPTARCGFCQCWEHLAQLRVGVLGVCKDMDGESRVLLFFLGWARLSERVGQTVWKDGIVWELYEGTCPAGVLLEDCSAVGGRSVPLVLFV